MCIRDSSRIDGRKKKNVICIDCNWLRARDEKLIPSARLAAMNSNCLLYTSDAADERSSVDLGGRRIIKKKKQVQLRYPTVKRHTKKQKIVKEND